MGSAGGMGTPVRMEFPRPTQEEAQRMERARAYQLVYPEIFYKLQPYILAVCDQMDTYDSAMPTQETIERMSDSIYEDVCRMYPDIAEYARECERRATGNPNPSSNPDGFGRDLGFAQRPIIFGREFRRRGLLRDLIDILLISEFLRRRRRRFF